MRITLLLSGLTAVSLAVPSFAEPVKLAPTSEWHVNYADDSCRLGRVFGEGKTRALLMMDRFVPSDSFQLLIASDLLTRTQAISDGRQGLRIRFGPGEDEQTPYTRPATLQEMPALIGSGVTLGVKHDTVGHQADVAAAKANGDKKKLKLLDALTSTLPVTPAREANVSFLEIHGASKVPIVLLTGKLDKPMAALRTCTDELLTHWGIDAEAHKSLSRKATPKGSPARWVTSDDYPSQLVARGVQGLIQFRLAIDENGAVSECHIQQSTRPDEFDRTVCRIMSSRARFDSALDAGGKPIKSYWRSSFSFIMP